MKNQPGTMRNHENPYGTIINQPGTMKNHENPHGTLNNQPSSGAKTSHYQQGGPTNLQ